MKKLNKNSKKYQKNVKERSKLNKFIGEKINIFADFICFGKTTLTEGFVKNTMLLQNLRMTLGDSVCQHIWIREDEIRNLDDFQDLLKKGVRLELEATPYGYGESKSGKIRSRKYSLGNISILNVTSKK